MKSTIKKGNKNNKTKKNTVTKCMETFVENKIKYWTNDINKQIKKLENKKLTNDEHKLLTKLKKDRKEQIKTLTNLLIEKYLKGKIEISWRAFGIF